MSHGMADELMRLQRYKSNGRMNYLDVAFSGENAIERRPCAFDEIGEHIVKDNQTLSEYDSEG